MLFISNSLNFKVLVRPEMKFPTRDGHTITTQRALRAQFHRGFVPPWAREQAEKAGLIIRGKGDDLSYEDKGILYSGYDTVSEQHDHGWDDETRVLVEQRLLNHPGYGTDFIRVERAVAPPPSPNWVKLTTVVGRRTLEQAVAKAKELVSEQGWDPAVVVAFETDAARSESAAIIAAMGELGDVAPSAPDEDLVAA